MKHQLICDWRPAPRRGQTIVRALLTIEGDVVAASSVPNLNIALVLDRSGSMAGEKLDAARHAAAQLVQRMAPEHKASLVVFDDEVQALAEGATAGSGQLSAAIAAIEIGGCTNLSGGWLMGRTLAARHRDDDRSVNRIVLMTDGHANQGITDHTRLAAMCREAAAQGISTSTVGFGEGFDEDLLKSMAEAGNGNSWYIECVDQAAMVFLEEIEGLLSLSAQNLTVQLTGSTAARKIHIWGDWPSVAQGDHITVPLGDLYAREPRRLLVEFVVSNRQARAIDGAVAAVRLEADVMRENGGVEHQVVTFPIAANLEESARVEPTIETEVLLAQAAKARKDAAERQERGDSDGAGKMLRSAIAMMRTSSFANDAHVLREVRDLAAMEQMIGSGLAGVAEVKYMKQRAYNRSRGKMAYDQILARPPVEDEEPDATLAFGRAPVGGWSDSRCRVGPASPAPLVPVTVN